MKKNKPIIISQTNEYAVRNIEVKYDILKQLFKVDIELCLSEHYEKISIISMLACPDLKHECQTYDEAMCWVQDQIGIDNFIKIFSLTTTENVAIKPDYKPRQKRWWEFWR